MANDPSKPPSPQPGPEKPGAAPPSTRMSRNVAGWVMLVGLVLILLVFLRQNGLVEEISMSEFENLVTNRQIKELTFQSNGDLVDVVGKRDTSSGDPQGVTEVQFVVHYPKEMVDYQFRKDLMQRLPGVTISAKQESVFLKLLIAFAPWLLLLAIFWFVILRQLRSIGGAGGVLGNFGRSRHRVSTKEHTHITFDDIAGIDEAKEEVVEIVEFLKAPKKFQRLGGRIPRGVLLVGEPGCGKTLLAKAIAGEADVPFFSISGSDFVEMFVGVGASRVRDLFKQAKDNAPCIVFLDEIDAVGRKRGANFGGGGHDEREQTLNAILVEMDGFDTNDQVIVIAATNRVDVLDPALVRPGRFDRQVYVPLPDVQGRYEILKVHAKKIKLGPNVDLKRIARGTPGFSGAELAALVNESAMIATLADKDYVEHDDMEEARDKVRWGRSRRSRMMDEHEKRATAYHEAGHALVQALEKHADPLHKVSIIPRGPYGGVTFSLPEKDRMNYGRNYLLAQMRVLCAGRIAEEMFSGDVNSGVLGDIRHVTELARKMVTEWGMNPEVGFVSYGEAAKTLWMDLPGGRDYSERTAETIDLEVRKLIDAAYEQADRIIRENADKVKTIAEALLKYETLTGEEVHALIRGESLNRSPVSDLLDQEDARSMPVGVARPIRAKSDPRGGMELGGGELPQPG